MSDYDSAMTDADADRAYDLDLERHNREAHCADCPPEECLVCEARDDDLDDEGDV